MKKIIVSFVLAFSFYVGYTLADITATAIDLTAQGVDTAVVLDVGDYERFSMQAVYGDGTPDSHTITDGLKASLSITIPTTSSIYVSNRAATSITVVSPNQLDDDTITINGIVFTEGVQWSVNTDTNTVAERLKVIIDAHPDFVATRSGSVVYASATAVGTYANGWTVTTSASSNYLSISSATFMGGINAHTITINGVELTEGDEFVADSSSITTATNLSAAINADSTLNSVLSSSFTKNIVYATATLAGQNSWYISSSTNTIATAITSYGTDSDIDVENDLISETSHGITSGLQVLFSTGGNTVPSGLSGGTTYYAIKLNENQYQFASSTSNSVSGTAVDITDVSGGGTFTVAPLDITLGQSRFSWQGSNDNSNWFDLGVATVTVRSTTTVTTGWDFGEYNYKYLRLNFSAPTQGGVSIDTTLHGKK